MGLNEKMCQLLELPVDTQEFTDLFSIEENWDKVDKNIKIPKGTGLTEGECPNCEKTLRALHPKFCGGDSYYSIKCPHCRKTVGCHLEFTGWTCALHFEEYDEEVHA